MDYTTPQRYTNELPPHYKFYARTMLSLSALGCLAASMPIENFYRVDTPGLYIVFLLLAYPALVFFSLRNQPREQQQKYENLFSHLDALFMGMAITLANFHLLAILLLVSLIEVSALLVGGIKKFASSLVALILGAAVITPFHAINFTPEPSQIMLAGAFIPAIGFAYTIGHYLNTRLHEMSKNQDELLLQQKQLKLRSYKLSKYISPPVWRSIFSGKDVRLETQRKKITVFFSDVKGFSELAEEMEPEALTELLNNYLTEMSNIAIKYGGTIDKFIGDSIMVFYGDPHSRGVKADTLACVSMAIAMRKHMKLLQQKWRGQGIAKPLEIRMGINTGYSTVGNFGTESRMDYTLLGKEVNLASRLESMAEPGQILIAHETYSLIRDVIMCRDKGQIAVKGFRQPVAVYEVVDFRRDLGAEKSFVAHDVSGFSLYMDTEKVRNYDRDKIVHALEEAVKKIKDHVIS